MFSKLFKPKWQHPDPQIRLQAIDRLDADSAKGRELLTRLAVEDTAVDVRHAALERLPSGNLLLVWQQSEQAADRQLAMQLWEARELDQHTSKEQMLEKLQQASQYATFLEIIKFTSDERLHNAALSQLSHDDELLQLALQARLSHLRMAAAKRIQHTELLRQLQKESSDKKVQQWVRGELKRQRQQEKLTEQQRSRADQILLELQRLSRLPYDKLYSSRLRLLQQQWTDAQASVSQEQQRDYDAALNACESVVVQHQAEEARLARARDTEQQQQKLCEELKSVVASLQDEASEFMTSQAIAKQLELHTRWRHLTNAHPASPELEYQYHQLDKALAQFIRAWQRLEKIEIEFEEAGSSLATEDADVSMEQLEQALTQHQQMLDSIDWPAQFARPSKLKQMEQQLEQIRTRYQSLKGEAIGLCKHLAHRRNALQQTIAQKNLRQANRLYNYIERRIGELPPSMQASESDKLSKLAEQLSELRDWHEFATQPKKRELIERMQQAAQQPLAPLEQAERIKLLQQQWRELNSGDSDKDQELWDEFKSAADLAYQPCLAFYQQQDAIKANNLQQRLTICAQLEDYLQATDFAEFNDIAQWRHLEKIVRTAQVEWKAFEPVPANEFKPTQDRFYRVLKQLKAPLNDYRDANAAARERLVARAQKLVDSADIAEATEQCKALQAEWKQLGFTYRKQERQSWEAFRTACDAVFNRRHEQYEQQQQEKDARSEQVEALIEQLEQLKTIAADSGSLDQTAMQQIDARFNELSSQPMRAAKRLQQAYQQARSSIDRALAAHHRAAQQKRWQQLRLGQDLCHRIEQTALAAKPLETLLQQWQQLPLSDSDRQLMASRVEHAQTQLPSMDEQQRKRLLTNNDEKYLALLLQMEIAAELPTPDTYKADRMAFQLEQMQQSVTTSELIGLQQLRALLLELVQLGPVSAQLLADSAERLNAIWQPMAPESATIKEQ